jgi:hypothetical protein
MAKPTAYTIPGKYGFYSAYEKKRISREGAVDARNIQTPAILNRRRISEGAAPSDGWCVVDRFNNVVYGPTTDKMEARKRSGSDGSVKWGNKNITTDTFISVKPAS